MHIAYYVDYISRYLCNHFFVLGTYTFPLFLKVGGLVPWEFDPFGNEVINTGSRV